MFIFLIVVIWFFAMWLALHFIRKQHDKFTSEVTETSEPEKVQEEEIVPAPVKKKRVYKKRVKKDNKE